jgi:tetratricopeptide (TPR) repeat protein
MQFSLLWMLTGSPLTAGLVLLAAYAVADWYTFGFLRRFARAFDDWRRGNRLEQLLMMNPHDRKARADWGEILLSQRRWSKVLEVVTPVAQADAHDLAALYLLGVACLKLGKVEQGELFLKEVAETDPEFRRGEALLELGRGRLDRADKAALEPLAAFSKAHPHSVEGHFLVSRAHELLGDAAAAQAARDRCWHEYTTSLPYQRRLDRLTAWRARPGRPLLYGAVALAVLLAFGLAAQQAGPPAWSRGQRGAARTVQPE